VTLASEGMETIAARGCLVRAVVKPDKAAQDGCSVSPREKACECGVEDVTFTATAAEGWEFDRWDPAQTIRCPETGEAQTTAWFAPVLDISGISEKPICNSDKPITNIEVLTFTVTASQADDWTLNSITVHASGSGNDKEDITEVMLYHGDELLGSGTYNADNGSITFNFSPIVISAGGSVPLRLVYDLAAGEKCPSPVKDFNVNIASGDVGAEPMNYKPGHIHRGAQGILRMGCVWNVEQKQMYEKIQEAVDGAADGNTLEVCPGEYHENVDVNKKLTIRSKEGRDKTMVDAADKNDHVFAVSADDVTIRGFTIRGATGEGKAGVYVHGSVVKNVQILESFVIGNRHGVWLLDAQSATVQNNVISSNSESGVRIEGQNAKDNKVWDNKVGTDGVGVWSFPNKYGIHILNGASSNFIGDTGHFNLISGNSESGVRIEGQNTRDNKVWNNKIGANILGVWPLPNKYGIHILNGASSNFIGDTEHSNLISGNSESGVRIEGQNTRDNKVWDNKIGADETGGGALPNKYGIHILNGASSNFIGDTGHSNLISGNSESGVRIEGEDTKENKVRGNLIGADASSSKSVPNKYGVHILNRASSNCIGGKESGQGNVIVGNSESGIRMEGEGTGGNKVQGNFIGIEPTSNKAIPNKYGVHILNLWAHDWQDWNIIGGKEESKGNIISGNRESGVRVEGDDTRRVGIYSNLIGTDRNGAMPVPNKYGVHVLNKGSATIGREEKGGNLISGNLESGVRVENATADITGNNIGTNKDGTAALAGQTQKYGVHLLEGTSGCHIGGWFGGGNTISGNSESGVRIEGEGTDKNHIYGNLIGTNKSGTAPIPNKYGVHILNKARSNEIGAPGNLISGNLESGIRIEGQGTTDNRILGNNIGTNKEGTAAFPNQKQKYGIHILNKANASIIGEWNTISGNKESGIRLEQVSSTQIWGSRIGISKTSMDAIPNGKYGIYLCQADGSLIGHKDDKDKGNIIAGNPESGIFVCNGSGAFDIYNNTIGPNNGYGIRLSKGDAMEIKGNTIQGNKKHGIYIVTGEHNGIEENEIRENQKDGVHLEDNYRYTVKGNIIEKNKGHGLHVKEGREGEIEGNEIKSNSGNGINMIESGKSKERRELIRGNTVEDNKNGVYIENSDHIILGSDSPHYPGNMNTLNSNKEAGLKLYFCSPSDIFLGYNHYDNNKYGIFLDWVQGIELEPPDPQKALIEIKGNKGAGIYLDSSTGIKIRQLKIGPNNGDGIRLVGCRASWTSPNEIMKNVIEGNVNGIHIKSSYGVKIGQMPWQGRGRSRGPVQGAGFEKTGSESEQNTINRNKGSGIHLVNCNPPADSPIRISGNFVHSNWHGLYLNNSHRIQIISNTIQSNQQNGLYLKGSDRNEISACRISWNQRDGISMEKSSYNEFYGNVVEENGKDGFYIREGRGNKIIGPHSILSNKRHGIALRKTVQNRIEGFRTLSAQRDEFFNAYIQYHGESGVNIKKGSNGNIIAYYLIKNNDDGIYFISSHNNRIQTCRITVNWRGIKMVDSEDNEIAKTVVAFNGWWFYRTGIHLDNSSGKITASMVSEDKADGIICERGSHLTIRKSNICDNRGLGLINLDSSVVIDARDNWWGDASGPGGAGPGKGEAILGRVDISPWRSTPVALAVFAERDKVPIPAGGEGTTSVHFLNWDTPDDKLNVVVTDTLGWLPGPTTFTVDLSVSPSITIALAVPSGVPAGTVDEVWVSATSQADASLTEADSFQVVSAYQKWLPLMSQGYINLPHKRYLPMMPLAY